MVKLVEDFEVNIVYEDRTYERHQFSLSIKGKEYKGDFHEDDIQWHHPHPQQDFGMKQLEKIETEVRQLIDEQTI